MSVIDKNLGAIKLDEIALDEAQGILNVQENTNLLEVFNKIRNLIYDTYAKNTYVITSSSSIFWNGHINTLSIPANVQFSIVFSSLPEDALSPTLQCNYQVASITNWLLDDGDVLYLEISRSNLKSSSVILTDGINSSGVVGRRIRKISAVSFPQISEASNDNSLNIPLAYVTVDSGIKNLWWAPHGILWSNQISAIVGTVKTPTYIPIGTIMPIFYPGVTNIPSGPSQSLIDILYPGWALCNGQTISNPSSPFHSLTVPNLNSPMTLQPHTFSPMCINPPNIGGQRFLRGGSNSGGTGGRACILTTWDNVPPHNHSIGNSFYTLPHNHGNMVLRPNGTQVFLTCNNNSCPPYDDGVFDSARTSGTAHLMIAEVNNELHSHILPQVFGLAEFPYAYDRENQPPFRNLVYIIRVV